MSPVSVWPAGLQHAREVLPLPLQSPRHLQNPPRSPGSPVAPTLMQLRWGRGPSPNTSVKNKPKPSGQQRSERVLRTFCPSRMTGCLNQKWTGSYPLCAPHTNAHYWRSSWTTEHRPRLWSGAQQRPLTWGQRPRGRPVQAGQRSSPSPTPSTRREGGGGRRPPNQAGGGGPPPLGNGDGRP